MQSYLPYRVNNWNVFVLCTRAHMLYIPGVVDTASLRSVYLRTGVQNKV